ncbi:MAG: hypothetical protein KU37_05790 [Sulfuricurvum sp. PC08-66]|nr:MAG: hypothetical protein KU37_05790 [Sulfuricurvum sp. PC08-66]
MKKVLLLLCASFIALDARENPFRPMVDEHVLPISTNIPQKVEPFTHAKISLPDTARIVTNVIVEYQNLDGSIEKAVQPINQGVDWHVPITLSHHLHKEPARGFETVGKNEFIHFGIMDKRLKITTKDGLIRHFMMSKPYRVVLDFARMSSFQTHAYSVNKAPFKTIRLGNHKDYYRVVVELDGQYEYKIDTDNGVLIEIR